MQWRAKICLHSAVTRSIDRLVAKLSVRLLVQPADVVHACRHMPRHLCKPASDFCLQSSSLAPSATPTAARRPDAIVQALYATRHKRRAKPRHVSERWRRLPHALPCRTPPGFASRAPPGFPGIIGALYNHIAAPFQVLRSSAPARALLSVIVSGISCCTVHMLFSDLSNCCSVRDGPRPSIQAGTWDWPREAIVSRAS